MMTYMQVEILCHWRSYWCLDDTLELLTSAFDDESRLVLALESEDEVSSLLTFMRASLLQDCALDVACMLAMKLPLIQMHWS